MRVVQFSNYKFGVKVGKFSYLDMDGKHAWTKPEYVKEYCMADTFWRAEDAMKLRIAIDRENRPAKVIRWFK